MAESFLENSLEILTLTGQQQPSLSEQSPGDDLDKILPGFSLQPDNFNGSLSISLDTDSSNEQFDINALIDMTLNATDSNDFVGTEISDLLAGDDPFQGMFEEVPKPEPQEPDVSLASLQSTFIEQYYDPAYHYQSQPVQQPLSNVPVGSSPIEPKTSETMVHTYAYLNQQEEIHRQAKKSKKQRNHQQRHSTNVGPVEYIMHSGGCEPCTTAQMQYDYAYQQQQLEYDGENSKQIQIQSQPRQKFRPRTQNESKTSSHYLRCEVDVKPEYPTIAIPQHWFFASDMNLIEVALVGLDKELHPYALENKNCSTTLEDNTLIFKQNDPGVIYFRLTNEDFQNGYKTFMIELIKARQDSTLTKEVIRNRQLEHSMLRFTRIFQMGKGNFQRDEGSTEYSSVMSEAYGDVDIEHMGPQYGPMCGQEMVYAVTKGRILKNELKIQVKESHFGWEHTVENFTKNVNTLYFLMPAFPYAAQCESIKATIVIYYKDEELYELPYLYKGSLDQELAALRISNPTTTATSSSTSTAFDPLGFLSATNALANKKSGRKSSIKTPKRLENGLKK